jgi:hypothetical protein
MKGTPPYLPRRYPRSSASFFLGLKSVNGTRALACFSSLSTNQNSSRRMTAVSRRDTSCVDYMSTKQLPPGTRAPVPGIYEQIGPCGGQTGEEADSTRGKPVPPIERRGDTWSLVSGPS